MKVMKIQFFDIGGVLISIRDFYIGSIDMFLKRKLSISGRRTYIKGIVSFA